MSSRGSRLALCCLALLLSLSLYLKGHAPTVKDGSAALLRGGGGTLVRLSAGFPHPGVYRFPNGVSVATVINVTVAGLPVASVSGVPPAGSLQTGDILTLRTGPRQQCELSIIKMSAKERMLLGIPLEPDLLGAEEWSLLPGIGPALAGRIVADRHKNGAFGTVERLLRVPGIGPGKLEAIRKFF